jgi:RND family efflux transporter MFP subunit
VDKRADPSNESWVRFFIYLLLLVAFGCQNEAAQKKRGPPPSATVTVGKVTTEAMQVERRYLGEVWAVSDARLSVAEAGRVLRVHVAEGSKVKKGQLLVELDDRLARAELSEAKATNKRTKVQSAQADNDAERYALMEKERVVSQLEAEQQKSTAESLGAAQAGAEAAVQARSERVARHRLVAPFDGTITARAVDPGDWLSPGDVAVQLLTEQRLEVLVRVPPSLLDRLETLKSVEIVSEGRSVPARVSSSVGALNRETRTGLLRVEPESAPSWLRSGASVGVHVSLSRDGYLNVPSDAVVHGAVGTRVMRVLGEGDKLKVEKVDVHVVESGGDRVLIEAPGLKAGDRIVVRGNERLRPDQSVTLEGAIAPLVKE